MAKLRKIPSIEQGLYEAFGILKNVGVEDAIKNFTKTCAPFPITRVVRTPCKALLKLFRVIKKNRFFRDF